ncbi:VPLPA-CTERM sorting domain-containing protein [Methylicorpusculum oleiharenae]|uniref:VPLPA-CTERM sorting domain-containing protein n=1 Tax=Methylicorpusculum oleiharenae TaxID=1338687 RepID=UPI001356ED3A|nr:VPLPA-CTERM sorting domain-containing protein [Methylicorpusculum oleiharenae]MCD2450231.1 VPLPA-CTERM sorting domain-containing protein [Methylicorpusculum oleiharenae]
MTPSVVSVSKLATALSLATISLLAPLSASATTLYANNGGAFTFNLDSTALGNYAFGSFLGTNNYYLSSFSNTAASDPTLVSGSDFRATIGPHQISATNLVHDLTPVGTNPTGQQASRHVQATTAGFSIDSDTLAGVSGEKLGMTGLHGFYIPEFNGKPSYLSNGDFSLEFDPVRTSNGRSGWYVNNNFGFTLDVYDLANLNLTVTDANNWLLAGDLFMAPGNAGMLGGAAYTDVGGFSLGVGSYAVSSVPVPSAIWLMGSGLVGLAGMGRRKGVVAKELKFPKNSLGHHA